VAIPLSEGYSIPELARELGTTRRWVSSRLDELREELSAETTPGPHEHGIDDLYGRDAQHG
jgi:DNA-directed RNA polymerase specialized sigma24 family protein